MYIDFNVANCKWFVCFVNFVASLSSYISGQLLNVDGYFFDSMVMVIQLNGVKHTWPFYSFVGWTVKQCAFYSFFYVLCA